MEYFYVPPSSIVPPRLTIDGEEFQHLTHVMRKEPGDEIRVVDGIGNSYDARIIDTARRAAQCEITGHRFMEHEPGVSVTLAAGIVKNAARFDFLVEKATELGVRTIIPLATRRTIPEHAKTDRWQKLAIAAMKQSGRCVLPKVLPLTPFARFLSGSLSGDPVGVEYPVPKGCLWQRDAYGKGMPTAYSTASQEKGTSSSAPLKIIPHEKETSRTLRDLIAPGPRDTVICIGPEGGFSDEEVDEAVRAGFLPVSLGPRRLRTETAVIAALTLVLS